MRNYFRNQDDVINDPDVLQARYFVGKNLYFEVELALAEQRDSEASRSSAASGTTSIASAALSNIGLIYGGGGGDGIGRVGCPEENEMVWVNDGNDKPVPVPARALLRDPKIWTLYNPISRSFDALEYTELIENIGIYELSTASGASKLVTESHSIVRNTQDIEGTSMMPYWTSNTEAEILTVDLATLNIFADTIKKICFKKTGNAVKIHLKSGHIYMAGTGKHISIDHNLKRPEDFE